MPDVWFRPALPPLHHHCGWVASPGAVIPCVDPVIGPYLCPGCHSVLAVPCCKRCEEMRALEGLVLG